MQIIPVIDLKDGCVVSARLGDRAHYRPLNSPLCPSASVFAVIEAFLDLHNFKTIYIADLNAITHQGDHDRLITDVANYYRDIEFWLDNGCQIAEMETHSAPNLKPVIGSESQPQQISEKPRGDFILSLDFNSDNKLGSLALFENHDLWPQYIIIMTLGKVGSRMGPDFVKLSEYCRNHPDKQFIAAGGIRDTNDLRRLRKIGVHKALIASALHSGTISSTDIKNL